MEDVIERLRLSKETKIQEIEDEGRVNGIAWAMHHAEYDELRRMALVAAYGSENHEGAEEVYVAVTGTKNYQPDDMAIFYLIDHPLAWERSTHFPA